MAKSKATKTNSSEPAEESAPRGQRSQTWIHEGQAVWLEGEGFDLSSMTPGEIIALGHSRRNDYRKSDFYLSLKADHAESADSAKAAKAEARAEAKAAKAAEKAAAKPPTKKAPKGRKSAKGKAAADDGEDEDPFE